MSAPERNDPVLSLVDDFRSALGADRFELPLSAAGLVSRLREMIASRDHPDVGRSWPLAATGPYGPWFEQMPIEVVPPLPLGRPSEGILRLLDKAGDWVSSDGPDHERIFTDIFVDWNFSDASDDDRRAVSWLAFVLLAIDLPRPWRRDALYDRLGPAHRDVAVRSLVLSLAYIDLPWVPAERYLYACTHDTDEPVFIKAFRICARRHDERAFDHLRPIVRSPAAVLNALQTGKMYYPVGHAACSICPAQFAILGTDSPSIAEQREAQLLVRTRRPLSVPVEHARERLDAAIAEFRQPASPEKAPADLATMIEIPHGDFVAGVDLDEVLKEAFDWSTCTPRRSLSLPRFYIDKYPVTNAQYDAWSASLASLSDDERRRFEHPGQPTAKSHRRNTLGDPRFGPDHPVVGIDWFDAWAYARAHGKELPTEWQWEKAARGTDGAWYPWGNAFNPGALRDAAETYGREITSLVDWVATLSRGTTEFPASTTAPVTAHPLGDSPYGVSDMCGNCWEFTTTAFFTGEMVRPAFAEFTPVELMGSREGHVVIRGGAWSSPHSLIGAAYRGFDLLTDRHSEIGFRCVWNPPTVQNVEEDRNDRQ